MNANFSKEYFSLWRDWRTLRLRQYQENKKLKKPDPLNVFDDWVGPIFTDDRYYWAHGNGD